MAFLIAGTITFFLKANINMNNKRKNPATIKKPPAVLSTISPIHQASAVNKNDMKKKTSMMEIMAMTAPEAALDAALVAFALASWP